METWVIILIIVGVFIVACLGYVISTQRSLVSLDEFCKNALGQIEAQLNSRWDALLALAQTAARYSKYEAETMMKVIQERTSKAARSLRACLLTSNQARMMSNMFLSLSCPVSDVMLLMFSILCS